MPIRKYPEELPPYTHGNEEEGYSLNKVSSLSNQVGTPISPLNAANLHREGGAHLPNFSPSSSNPVLDWGGTNYETYSDPSVIFENEKFHMYWQARRSANANRDILYANSTDGENWSSPQIIYEGATATFTSQPTSPDILKYNGTYYLYIGEGSDGPISLLSGNSPTSLSEDTQNVIPNAGEWWSNSYTYVAAPSIYQIGGLFYIFYAARNEQSNQSIGVAVATDPLLSDLKYMYDNPIAEAASTWEGSRLHGPSLIRIGASYLLLYTGTNSSDIRRLGAMTFHPDIQLHKAFESGRVEDLSDATSESFSGDFKIPTGHNLYIYEAGVNAGSGPKANLSIKLSDQDTDTDLWSTSNTIFERGSYSSPLYKHTTDYGDRMRWLIRNDTGGLLGNAEARVVYGFGHELTQQPLRKSYNPFLEANDEPSWTIDNLGGQFALLKGNILHLWYHGFTGQDHKIGHATLDLT